ncbi:uncharacterized protein LOC21392621 [Morus notabilis]|uniref:uncharacterized protein LOC21392621 n=1 Tax=Morus notabilis TaxID=981085 RepID=UPI000CED324F|nr:uncharacterized protein LOC21392621 [Morus notabilis]
MDAQPSLKTEIENEQGEVETKVNTVDYQSSAGQGQQKRDVQVIHKSHPSENSTTTGGGSVLSSAATAASAAVQSSKDALSGK